MIATTELFSTIEVCGDPSLDAASTHAAGTPPESPSNVSNRLISGALPAPTSVMSNGASFESLLEGVMGDRVLLAEMSELWMKDSHAQANLIRLGIEQGDCLMIQRAAHAIKGSVGTFQAVAAYEGRLPM